MSLAQTIADARQWQRVHAAQAAVWRRALARFAAQKEPARRWSRWRLLGHRVLSLAFPSIPMLVPMFAWFAARDHEATWSFAACIGAFVLITDPLFQSQALEFSSEEVLRAPSKAGVVLARLWAHAPRLVFLGACLAVAFALRVPQLFAVSPVAAALLLVALVLAPTARTLSRLRVRLLTGESVSPLIPCVATTVFAALLWRELQVPGAFRPDSIAKVIAAGTMLVFSGIGLATAIVKLRRELDRAGAALLAELAGMPHAAAAIALILPPADITALLAQPIAAALIVLTTVMLALTGLAQVLADVRMAEETTRGSMVQSAPAHGPPIRRAVAATTLPTRHRHGPSPLRARLYERRRRTWFRPGELRGVRLLRRLPAFCSALFLNAYPVLVGFWVDMRRPWMLFLFACMLSSLNAARMNWREHRLGVPFAQQVRLSLRLNCWFAVVPTLTMAIGKTVWLGGDEACRVGLATIAAGFALGAGWRGLGAYTELATNRWLLVPLLLAIAGIWLPAPPLWLPIAAAGLGLVGVCRRLQRLDEAALLLAMQDATQ